MYNQEVMKVVARNKRAKFDYDIQDTLVAGVVLSGPEVKSVKRGEISLKGSYVTINNGEVFLINAHISPYKHAQADSYDETRTRKLLLHKQEIKRLGSMKQSGMTLVPLAAGIERGLVKIEIGIGHGRKKHDKRQVIKQREAIRDMRATQS